RRGVAEPAASQIDAGYLIACWSVALRALSRVDRRAVLNVRLRVFARMLGLLHRGHAPAHEQRQATHDGVRPRSPGHQLSSSPPTGSQQRRTADRNFHLHRAPIAQRLKPSSTARLIMFRTIFLSSVIAALAMSGLACRQPSTPAYTPGLGEIMTLTQMRHSKL